MADEQTDEKSGEPKDGAEEPAAAAPEAAKDAPAEAAGEGEGEGEADAKGDDADADEPFDDDAAKADAKDEPAEDEPKDKDKSKKSSAGARLAAQRAAKAAQKAAKRGRQKNEVEVQAQKRAEKISRWYEEHRVPVIAGLGTVAAAIAAVILWSFYGHATDEHAAEVLTKAVTTSVAPVHDPDDELPVDQPAPAETYPTAEARTRRTLTEMRDVVSHHSGTRAAVWARLGAARAMLDLGQNDQARAELEKAIHEADGDVTVLARAYEGIAFSYEAAGNTHQAVEKFQALAHAGDGAYRDLAEYHLARMYLAQHENDRAKETLRVLVNRLRERNDSEDGAASPYVLTQAELRLAQLDSSLVPRTQGMPGGGMMIGPNGERMGGPGGGGGIDDEQLQQLIRQLQEKQGGTGGGGGGE